MSNLRTIVGEISAMKAAQAESHNNYGLLGGAVHERASSMSAAQNLIALRRRVTTQMQSANISRD